MNRRDLLSCVAGALSTYALSGCGGEQNAITGSFLGASYDVGHLLRNGGIPEASSEERTPIAIIGGGIAGLSAAWWLTRHNVGDFRLFELEPEIGGNARSGQNAITAYPWGAHYVPLPTKESAWVRALFEELGVIEGYDTTGSPVYNERYLCAAPQERLFIHGRWQEGLVPTLGAAQQDLDDFERFKAIIDEYKHRRDHAGRKAFAIPMELSSRDPDLLELDQISVAQFLDDRGLRSKLLHWYVNYACRDDFGCRYSDVSAWAGIHYYASRDTTDDDTVLTWPEGNGWIVRRLREKLDRFITSSAMAFRIEPKRNVVAIDIYHAEKKTSTRVLAEHVVFSCPSFLARFILSENQEMHRHLREFQYAPWLVANLSLDSLPIQRRGASLSWDNVIYNSNSLGYVVATHQLLATYQKETVLTYYYALAGNSPEQDRERLLRTDWKGWADFILTDLSKPHPEIREIVRQIDMMRWGHAMIRPRPGFIWGEARRRVAESSERVHFAHSDLSGFSIFEEAHYRGILAAEAVLRGLR